MVKVRLGSFAEGLDREFRDEMVSDLASFVEIESGSYDKPGVDRAGAALMARLRGLGFQVDVLEQREFGNHCVGRRAGTGAGRLLVLVHLDTVWPQGTLHENPFRVSDDRAFGPGVLDMKGGWVVLLWALRGLARLDWGGLEKLTVFATGDEELGSPSARQAIEAEARAADWALVMEPARESGALVTGRGAVGAVYIDVTGVTAHATGRTNGASAVVEAAHMVLELERLNDRSHGVIVNVGVISGGTARQVVPDQVRMSVDLRAATPERAVELVGAVQQIVDERRVAGTDARLSGGITRPAYPAVRGQEELFQVAVGCGKELGLNVIGEQTRGGSDGNFSAAVGVPTLDGLGPEGAGTCTRGEYVAVESLARRAALLAGVMSKLSSASLFA